VGVFISPTETFNSIARKPDWVVPLVIMCVLSFAVGWMIASKVDFTDLARQATDNPSFAKMPAEQQERMVGITASMMRVATYVNPILSIIGLLVSAGVMLIAVRAMGGQGNFAQSFSVATYAWYPRLLKGVIAAIVLLNRKSISFFMLADPVRSNPGFLVDPKLHPVAFAFLTSIDIFSLWTVALFVIGYSAISRLSRGKTAAIVIILWLIGVGLTLIGPAMQGLRK
jgi:hypothetical protein